MLVRFLDKGLGKVAARDARLVRYDDDLEPGVLEHPHGVYRVLVKLDLF